MEILFKNRKELSEEWLVYLENEARSLSENGSVLDIENYIDREALNPQVSSFLESIQTDDTTSTSEELSEPLILSAMEMVKASSSHVFPRFRRLKRKIRKIFCEVTKDIDADWKSIIKAVLIALIPAFAGGLPALVVPIVIGLVALMMKRGYSAVCPA